LNHFGIGGSEGPRFGVTFGEIVELVVLEFAADGKASFDTFTFGEALATVEGVENDISAGFIGGVCVERLCSTGSFSNKLDGCRRPLPMTPCEGGT
jgi:hypothetical protein